jgi:prophage antirepressor-like protein
MRSSGRPESRGAWTEVRTVTAFEDAYQDRILRAVWKQDDLWLVAADVGAILGARNVERMVSRMPSGAKGVATFYTAGRPETLDVIETFALGSMIIDSNAPTMSDFRRWLTGSLLPAAFRQSDCRFRIRDDGTSQFQTNQIGQFDLTFGEDGVLYVTRVLWRERTKRPTLTPLCLLGALPV